jgi:hypothetical protein
MSESDIGVVLAHGGWADGSSWSKVIAGLRSEGVKAVAAPLPLTSLADDVAVKGAKTLIGLDRGHCASPERIARWPCRSSTSRSCRC